MSFVMEAPLNN